MALRVYRVASLALRALSINLIWLVSVRSSFLSHTGSSFGLAFFFESYGLRLILGGLGCPGLGVE